MIIATVTNPLRDKESNNKLRDKESNNYSGGVVLYNNRIDDLVAKCIGRCERRVATVLPI